MINISNVDLVADLGQILNAHNAYLRQLNKSIPEYKKLDMPAEQHDAEQALADLKRDGLYVAIFKQWENEQAKSG